MRLPFEKKHVKYIDLTDVKHNSLIKQQQPQCIKHKLKKKKIILAHVVNHKQ